MNDNTLLIATAIALFILLFSTSPVSIPVYIISLKHRTDRLKACMTRLHGVYPHIIDAVDGRTLTGPRPHKKLTKGEIGCFMSHVKALSDIASSSAPYGLVLEDDAILLTFPDCLKWIKKLPKEWEVLSLGCNYTLKNGEHVAPGLVRMNDQFLHGTHAILYSKAGARRLVKHALSTGVTEPYDIWLSHNATIYLTVPSHATVANVHDTDTQSLR